MSRAMREPPRMVHGTSDPALGAAIRQARENAGLTQAQLAVRAGLAVGTLSRLEDGHHGPELVEREGPRRDPQTLAEQARPPGRSRGK
jgi:DNA-binding XRE family transcriptional regulator